MIVQITPPWHGARSPNLPPGGYPGGPREAAAGAASSADGIVVRPVRIGEMHDIERLIRGFANKNLMLPRSFDQLARTFREFVVAVDEADRILGCGALRIYNEALAEICSLAIDLPHQGRGIGRMIVEHLVQEAKELDLKTVFALTLEPAFFASLGFDLVPKENFPPKVWADCRNCPKLRACDEVAVARDVNHHQPIAGIPS